MMNNLVTEALKQQVDKRMPILTTKNIVNQLTKFLGDEIKSNLYAGAKSKAIFPNRIVLKMQNLVVALHRIFKFWVYDYGTIK